MTGAMNHHGDHGAMTGGNHNADSTSMPMPHHGGSESGGGGMDMGGGGMMHMYMYASDRPGAFLFKFWNPNTDGWYALSCAVVILLGVLQALLALLRDRLALRVLANARRARRREKRQQERLARTHSNDKVLASRSTPLVSNVGGPGGGTTTTTTLKVDGMTCASCINTIRASLLEVGAVTAVAGDLARGRVHVTHAPGARAAALVDAVEDVGFDAAVDTAAPAAAPLSASAAGTAAGRSYGSIQGNQSRDAAATDAAAPVANGDGGGNGGGGDDGGDGTTPYPVAQPVAAWYKAPAALKAFVMLANAGSVTLGYFLMLIAMTFNWGLFLSVVAGISCGYGILLRDKVVRRKTGGGGTLGSMLFDELPSGGGDCCA